MLDSQYWKEAADAAAAQKMRFRLEGDSVPTSRGNARGSWISTAEGIVVRVEESRLRIDGQQPHTSPASVLHSIPPSFELGPLLGRRVRVALLHVAAADGALTQTLTISGYEGSALVIGHAGEVRGVSHTLGSLHVYAALSQRPGGPMAFGTARVQALVREGNHIRVRDDDEMYVMHFEARRGKEASYAIGLEDFWQGPRSTMR